MSRHPYPVRVSDDGVAAIRNPYATGSEATPWLITDNAPGSDAAVADWTPYAPALRVSAEGDAADRVARVLSGTAVLAAALTEWTAHWPPRTGNDIDETVYGPLAELSADELEKLAHAAGELSRKAWEARAVKMTEEARAARGITWATVTVTSDGKLLPDSVVTVNEVSVPVPEHGVTGSILAANRLSAALRTIGYQAVNLRDTTLDGERLSFLVQKVPAGE